MKIINLILSILMFLSLAAWAEISPQAEEAIKNSFPGFQEYKVEGLTVDNQEFKVFTVLADNNALGWAVVCDEMGKIKPITFLVGIDTKGKVLDVYVLEYRDMFGSEIKRRSFLRQFQGKSLKNPLRIGQDIDAVTQATISSQAAASAVRKSLAIIEGLQKQQ